MKIVKLFAIILIGILVIALIAGGIYLKMIESDKDVNEMETDVMEPSTITETSNDSEEKEIPSFDEMQPTASEHKQSESNPSPSQLKKAESDSGQMNSQGEVDDTHKFDFEPEEKPGYIYVPGEGYLPANNNVVSKGDAMDGKDFWEVLNDPNNKQVGY